MKRLLWLVPLFALAAVLYWNGVEVDASTNASVTLNAGGNAKIVPSGCTLSVQSATGALVKVKCSGSASSTADPEAVLQPNANITLTAGKSVKVKANQCTLAVIKNKPALVKVKCNATATPTPTQPSNTVKVGNGGLNYSPQTITIHVGQTVHWTWSGSNHTVTSGTAPNANGQFCSPNDMNCGTANASNTGATYDHTFNSQGTFPYFCKIHGASMSGSVVVEP